MEAITINMCRFIKELFDLINACPNKDWRKMLTVLNPYISSKNMGFAKNKTISQHFIPYETIISSTRKRHRYSKMRYLEIRERPIKSQRSSTKFFEYLWRELMEVETSMGLPIGKCL